MKTILLIMIGLSSFLSADFTKSGSSVSDNKTGLVWQDNNETNGTQRTWQGAIDYCEALSLDGHDDWRLPNINELKSIIDRSKREPAMSDTFEYVGSNNYYVYWSSSTLKSTEYHAWYVAFDDGDVYGNSKDYSLYVRCVRDGQ